MMKKLWLNLARRSFATSKGPVWFVDKKPNAPISDLKAALDKWFPKPDANTKMGIDYLLTLYQYGDPKAESQMRVVLGWVPPELDDNKSPLEQIERYVKQHGQDGFLMPETTAKLYKQRRVPSVKNVTLLTRTKAPNVNVFALPVVSGSSGSGKTWFMINSRKDNEIGLYFTGEDLNFDPKKGEDREARNSRVIQCLLDAINKLLTADVRKILQQCTNECDLFIVIDELGTHHELLRGLCASARILEDRVQASLGMKIKCDFMAGGTGADGVTTGVGSLPGTYSLMKVPESDEVWSVMLKDLKEGSLQARTFSNAMEGHPSVKRLSKNSRMAALMFNYVKDKQSPIWHFLGSDPSPRACKSTIPLFLADVAVNFRRLGALSSVTTTAGIEEIRQQALALLFFPQWQNEDTRENMVASYGVVVDEAIAVAPRSEIPPTPFELVGEKDECKIYAPPQRFKMPIAHFELFRLGYGFEFGQAPGEGFEAVLSQYFQLLLLGGNGVLLPEFLAKLGHFSQKEDVKAVKLSYTAVSVLQLSRQIGPEKKTPVVEQEWAKSLQELLLAEKAVEQEWVKSLQELLLAEKAVEQEWVKPLQELLLAKKAVVLVNGPRAAFADLIVLIPEAAVILVHAKDFQESTSLSTDQVEKELFKMGHPRADFQHSYVAGTATPDLVPSGFRGPLHDVCFFDCLIPLREIAIMNKLWIGDKNVDRQGFMQHLQQHDGDKCSPALLEFEKAAKNTYQQSQQLLKSLCEMAHVPLDSVFWAIATTQSEVAMPADTERLLRFHVTSDSIHPIPLPTRDQARDSLIDEVAVRIKNSPIGN